MCSNKKLGRKAGTQMLNNYVMLDTYGHIGVLSGHAEKLAITRTQSNTHMGNPISLTIIHDPTQADTLAHNPTQSHTISHTHTLTHNMFPSMHKHYLMLDKPLSRVKAPNADVFKQKSEAERPAPKCLTTI